MLLFIAYSSASWSAPFAPPLISMSKSNLLSSENSNSLPLNVLEPVIKPIYQVEQPVVDDEQFVLDSMDILLNQPDV